MKEMKKRKEKCRLPSLSTCFLGRFRKLVYEMHGCRYDRDVKKTRWTVSKQTITFLLVSGL